MVLKVVMRLVKGVKRCERGRVPATEMESCTLTFQPRCRFYSTVKSYCEKMSRAEHQVRHVGCVVILCSQEVLISTENGLAIAWDSFTRAFGLWRFIKGWCGRMGRSDGTYTTHYSGGQRQTEASLFPRRR